MPPVASPVQVPTPVATGDGAEPVGASEAPVTSPLAPRVSPPSTAPVTQPATVPVLLPLRPA